MISTLTEVYCVIGKPVSHSLSPLMHNAAFYKTGHDAVYVAFEVEDIAGAVMGIRELGVRGASVTIPHKVAVVPHLDELDDTARRIGAVNTIVHRAGKLKGYNTDCLGAVRALTQKADLQEKKVLIVGAGGAARAVGFGVAAEKGRVTITNRTAKKGMALARDLQAEFRDFTDIDGGHWDIIVNTTAVGMTPDVNTMPVPDSVLQPGRVVMDIVYTPMETLLLRRAAQMGCMTVDGVSMFVYQGACQFELWTGERAPYDDMETIVRNTLKVLHGAW